VFWRRVGNRLAGPPRAQSTQPWPAVQGRPASVLGLMRENLIGVNLSDAARLLQRRRLQSNNVNAITICYAGNNDKRFPIFNLIV
jgi:hypothetical protein